MQCIVNTFLKTIQNKINNYLQTPLRPIQYTSFISTLVISNEISSPISILSTFTSFTTESEKLHYNATAQKNSLAKQECTENQLNKLKELYNVKQKLKKYATAQAKSQAKKCEALENKEEVIRYDSPEHSSFLLLNSDLLKQMHSYIKFSTLPKKGRKKLLKKINSSNAKRHHYSIAIQVNSVSRNEMPEHLDEYYCLQMIKNAKQFASAFASHSVIISQEDKTKVLLRILAVRRTFKTIQSFYELVAIP
ncbi:10157_t:CDS:2, partial [Scutellospora calospora]